MKLAKVRQNSAARIVSTPRKKLFKSARGFAFRDDFPPMLNCGRATRTWWTTWFLRFEMNPEVFIRMLKERPGRGGSLGFWNLNWILMFWSWMLKGRPGRGGRLDFGDLEWMLMFWSWMLQVRPGRGGRFWFGKFEMNHGVFIMNVKRTTRTMWTTWFLKFEMNFDVLILNVERTTRTRWTTWFLDLKWMLMFWN